MIIGKQSLTLKCLTMVFSLKSFFEKLLVSILWAMRVYIVLVKILKRHLKLSGKEFRGSLVTWPKS